MYFNKPYHLKPYSVLDRRGYLPHFSDKEDYNTNAKSYYDYLAKFNHFTFQMVEFINRLMDRNIAVKDSNTIQLIKHGDWLDNGDCGKYDHIITLTAKVKRSKQVETINLDKLSQKTHTLENAIKEKTDGIYSRDYTGVLNTLNKDVGNINNRLDEHEERLNNIDNSIKEINRNIENIQNDIKNINSKNDKLENAIKKIINNLNNSGATDGNGLDFNFKPNRNIATGNINLFGGTPDGSSFIRTNNGKSENDLFGGV